MNKIRVGHVYLLIIVLWITEWSLTVTTIASVYWENSYDRDCTLQVEAGQTFSILPFLHTSEKIDGDNIRIKGVWKSKNKKVATVNKKTGVADFIK